MGQEVAELREANDEIMRAVYETQSRLNMIEQRIGLRIVK